MPDEDKKVLRSCHVFRLENIGDPVSICDHLYQNKTQHIVIDILRGQRENQEAAAILLNKRSHGADQNNDDK